MSDDIIIRAPEWSESAAPADEPKLVRLKEPVYVKAVYVVERGTEYEGGSVQAMYSTPESAIAHARFLAKEDSEPMVDYCRKSPTTISDENYWIVREKPDDKCVLLLVWGCYYACVKEMAVLP